LGSRDSLEGLAASALTAGLASGFIDPMFNQWQFGKATEGTIQTQAALDITKGFQLSSWQGMVGFTAHNAVQGFSSAAVSSAVYGGSFNDYLKVNMESQGNNVLSALAYNQIGNLGGYLADSGGAAGNASQFGLFVEGGIGRVGLHSVTGGLITEATGGDFATGAAAAGLNQWLSPQLDQIAGHDGPWRTAASQLAGLAGAMMVGGDVNDGAWIAKQADTYNRQLHSQELKLIADNYKQYAAERGISEEQALKELIYQAHILVDASVALDKQHADWALLQEYDTAAAWMFLQDLSATNSPIMHSDGVQTRPFQATDAQWLDSTINRHHLRDIEDGFTGELMGLGRRPILTAFDMNTGIGNYSATLGMARDEAADALRDQTLMIMGGAFAAPALISGTAGAWGFATTQGQFWAGTASHIGLRGAQSAGAHVSTSVSLLSHKAQAAYQFGSSYFYTSSSGALIANPKVQQGVLDFIDGLVVPGTPAPSLFGYGGWAYGVAATIGQEGD
jgi:hypothetical protein